VLEKRADIRQPTQQGLFVHVAFFFRALLDKQVKHMVKNMDNRCSLTMKPCFPQIFKYFFGSPTFRRDKCVITTSVLALNPLLGAGWHNQPVFVDGTPPEPDGTLKVNEGAGMEVKYDKKSMTLKIIFIMTRYNEGKAVLW